MHLLAYGDFRTHHAQSWVEGVRAAGITVSTLSSTRAEDGFEDVNSPSSDWTATLRNFMVSRGLNTRVRQSMALITSRPGSRWDPLQSAETLLSGPRYLAQGRALQATVQSVRPDVVHSLRAPYEGVMALSALRHAPLPITLSTWGQDFRFQAAKDPFLRSWLRRTMPRVDGLHVDAPLDEGEAQSYGLRSTVPVLHAAGNFGVDKTLFYPADNKLPLVVYPRGLRRYVNHRAFLEVVRSQTGGRWSFVGVGLVDDPEAKALAGDPSANLRLVPEMSRSDFGDLLRPASIVISPAVSDGTPNSIVEAMACGAYVMAGDIPTVRDFLMGTGGAFALLDPSDGPAWARRFAELLAVWDPKAAGKNAGLVPPEFDRQRNMTATTCCFEAVVNRRHPEKFR